MKQVYRTLPGKVITYVALLLSVLLLAGSVLAGAYMIDDGRVFTYTEEAFQNELISNQIKNTVWPIIDARLDENDAGSRMEDAFEFVITDADDNILLESAEAKAVQKWDYHYTAFVRRDGDGKIDGFSFYPTDEYEKVTEKVTIVISPVPGSAVGNRFQMAARLIHIAYTMRYAVFAVALLALAATVALGVLLLCAAARRPHDDGVYPGALNRVPFDLILLLFAAALAGGFVALYDAGEDFGAVLFAALFLLLLLPGLLMSLAARVKEHSLLKNTIAYRLLRLFRKAGRGVAHLLKSLPLIWKTLLGLAVVSAAELIPLLLIVWNVEMVFFWFIEKAVLVPVVLYVALTLRKLQAGGRALANGDLGYRVNTDKMIGDFKEHGANLNSISRGIAIAVEDRLKSERMKTELITNVSHDIKTPVTSILNYAALIQKEAGDSDAVREYSEVLVRQSEKLKKLVEDLIEASKAATGNLDVALSPCDASLFLNQASGEYEKKLRDAGLTLVVRQPEDEIMILADGRRMWRIFDNLMNNICKYAMPGTRAYLTLEKEGDQAVITFKNTSREPLDLTEDQLLERFARGDASRNTEGNGLGLSIAKSITELQNGSMRIFTDGDLFKAQLFFPILSDGTRAEAVPDVS